MTLGKKHQSDTKNVPLLLTLPRQSGYRKGGQHKGLLFWKSDKVDISAEIFISDYI